MILVLGIVIFICVAILIYALFMMKRSSLKIEIIVISSFFIFLSVVNLCSCLYNIYSVKIEQSKIDLNTEYSLLQMKVEDEENLSVLEKIELNRSVLLYNKKIIEGKEIEKSFLFRYAQLPIYKESKVIDYSYGYFNKDLKVISTDFYSFSNSIFITGMILIYIASALAILLLIVWGIIIEGSSGTEKIYFPWCGICVFFITLLIGILLSFYGFINIDNTKITDKQIENQYNYDILAYKADIYNDVSQAEQIYYKAEIDSYNLKLDKNLQGLKGIQLYPIKIEGK